MCKLYKGCEIIKLENGEKNVTVVKRTHILAMFSEGCHIAPPLDALFCLDIVTLCLIWLHSD